MLPFTTGAHAGMGTSFVLLDLHEPEGVRFVYIEDLASSDYLDEAPQVRRYSLVFDRLLGAALVLAPADWTAFLNDISQPK